jgi:tetratricopeptide (TPR) repeat protein
MIAFRRSSKREAGMRSSLPLVGVAAVLMLAGPVSLSRALADDADTCEKASGDEAIAACTRAINSGRSRGHDLAGLHVNRGVEYNHKGDNDRAIGDYNEAIRLDPKLAFAYSNRGNAYSAKGDRDRAITDYTEAIRLDPKYAHAYNNRGDEYRRKGDNDRAITDLTEAIRLDPKYAQAYCNRGLVKRAQGDATGANTDIDKAKQLTPNIGSWCN